MLIILGLISKIIKFKFIMFKLCYFYIKCLLEWKILRLFK